MRRSRHLKTLEKATTKLDGEEYGDGHKVEVASLAVVFRGGKPYKIHLYGNNELTASIRAGETFPPTVQQLIVRTFMSTCIHSYNIRKIAVHCHYSATLILQNFIF